jgi:hypothetical protein
VTLQPTDAAAIIAAQAWLRKRAADPPTRRCFRTLLSALLSAAVPIRDECQELPPVETERRPAASHTLNSNPEPETL